MKRDLLFELGLLLLVLAVVLAGPLGAAWPYIAATGAGLVALRAVAALLALMTSRRR